MQTIHIDPALTCAYIGPILESGPLPAFFYFAFSAQDSLTLAPYNLPVTALANEPIRLFSFTIAGHEPGREKTQAIQYWADAIAARSCLLDDFFDKVSAAIESLIEKNIVDPDKIAIGGLSRGAFVATHIAARVKKTSLLLGFAPLTHLQYLDEFKPLSEVPDLQSYINSLNLPTLTPHLTHLKALRFYISTLDTRVGTEHCYNFMRMLTEELQNSRIRDRQIELEMSFPVGHKGHGTLPHVFEEGALFVKQRLLG